MYVQKVWHLVLPPKNKAIIGNRWVYNIKKDEKSNIAHFKSRLVAQGFK